ncbi:MAG TPA: SpoIIE family protein phosphatase [Streptosporangiaceae bacterium]|nr:SpoIIE family protein phosphatase [Streptosporangiaceae bacterium]
MTVNGDAYVARLTELVARQRTELDQLQAEAAERAVIDLARGVLMERLGCAAADAARQLSKIAEDVGVPLIQLASDIVGEPLTAPRLSEQSSESVESSVAVTGAAMELAEDGTALATAMLEQTLADAGAVGVAIWMIAPDGAVELAGQAGFGPSEASRWQRIPPGANALAAHAAGDAAEFWWANGRPAGDQTALIGSWESGARAVVPVLTENGRCIGALEVCWPAPIGDFADWLRRQIDSLAGLAAHALGARSSGTELAADHREAWVLGLIDGLAESALFASAIRDDSGKVSDFRIVHVSQGFRDPDGRLPYVLAGQSLIEAYPWAAIPAGLFHRAVDVLRTGTPQHVTGEVIGTVSGTGQIVVASVRIVRLFDGVAISWRHEAESDRLAALVQHAQRLGRFGGWEENLSTGAVHWTEQMFTLFGRPAGQPVSLSELPSCAQHDDRPAVEAFRSRLLEDKVPTAAMFRIVRADDASIRQVRAFAEPVTNHYGDLIAVRGAYQDVSAHYHTELALAATRDLLTDTQERADEEHRLAMRLQQAITPRSSHLVETAGLDVAARYRPAGQGHLVSGDWYDTVLLPSGQVMLVVGDVAGHGIDAVTGMVALRNCLRGLAITGAGPAALIAWLNEVACHLTDETFGTAICGLFDPAEGVLRWTRAGHLPAVLVRDGTASVLPQPRGVLLGADPAVSYQEETTPLLAGDTLLLFTDGLIERRDQSIDDSIQQMLEVASRPVTDIDAYADHLVAHAFSDTDDDACLVAVTLRGS